jgi:Bacterial extracellular solute-binding proteins, family 5 Middle
MRSRCLFSIVAALAAATIASPAAADKASDTLRIVWRDAIPNIDPYYNQLRVGLIVGHHYLDTLVYRDPETFAIKPQLAKSWKNVDDTTIEFELRDDVKFHNGDKFTADDVVYTLNTVISPDSKVSVPSNYNWIAKAKKIGDYKVRVTYKKPFPAALAEIPVRRAHGPVGKLHQHRTLEPVGDAHRLHVGRGGVGSCDRDREIASKPGQRKAQGEHGQRHETRERQPADQEPEHAATLYQGRGGPVIARRRGARRRGCYAAAAFFPFGCTSAV